MRNTESDHVVVIFYLMVTPKQPAIFFAVNHQKYGIMLRLIFTHLETGRIKDAA